MSYSAGDKVIYGTHGVCEIKEISSIDLVNEAKEYYVLCPIVDPRSKIFVPCDNEALLSQMREVLSPEEINSIIGDIEPEGMKWISNDAKRKEICSGIIRKGDCRELMQMIEMLYRRQAELKNQKKHFHITDERFLKDAERMLNEEFSFSLGISAADVPEYIISRVKGA